MHELVVTENILNIATCHANQASAQRVTDIHITLGQLSSIVDDSVQFYWDIISKGTVCEGAILHFNRIPAEMACLNCGQQYYLDEAGLQPCPSCQSTQIKLIAGDEFWLDSIEIEQKQPLLEE